MIRLKKIVASSLVWLLLPILTLLASCSSEESVEPIKPLKPLHVATGNWEPYIGEGLPNNGPLAEKLAVILAERGYVPEFKFYSWPMVETHLRTGYPFIALPIIESAERKKKGFKFSAQEIGTFEYVLFYHKKRSEEAQTIKSLEDLKGIEGKVGYIRGYAKLPGLQDNDLYKEVFNTVDGFNQLRDAVDGSDELRDGDKIHYLLESKAVGINLLASSSLIDDKDDYAYLGQDKAQHNEPSDLIKRTELKIMYSPQLKSDFRLGIDKELRKQQASDFFKGLDDRIASSNEAVSEMGVLVSSVGKQIYGYSSDSVDESAYIIPLNSKVMILKWSPIYLKPMEGLNQPPEHILSEVKILNGPLKGKVVWVENQNITLEP